MKTPMALALSSVPADTTNFFGSGGLYAQLLILLIFMNLIMIISIYIFLIRDRKIIPGFARKQIVDEVAESDTQVVRTYYFHKTNPYSASELLLGSSIKHIVYSYDKVRICLSGGIDLIFEPASALAISDKRSSHQIDYNKIFISENFGDYLSLSLEEKINSVRQLYTIIYLSLEEFEGIDSPRIPYDVSFDIEGVLRVEDRSLIVAVGEGSLWFTLVSKTKASKEAAKALCMLFYKSGREAVLKRTEIETDRQQLELDKQTFLLARDRANTVIDLEIKIDKIKDPRRREQLRKKLLRSVDVLSLPPPP